MARRSRRQLLALTAIALISVNLRTTTNSMAAVLPAVRSDLGLSATVAGILNALPGLCFVVFSFATPMVVRRLGAQRVVAASLVAMAGGQVIRAALPGAAAVFGGSVLALAGTAMANVLLPGLVRSLFPRRVPAVMAASMICLLGGAAAASGLTVPIGRGFDADWRLGIGSWAVLACLALIPWATAALVPRNAPVEAVQAPRTTIPLRTLARNPVALTSAAFFAVQSMQAYVLNGWLSQILVDAGVDLAHAGAAAAAIAAMAAVMAAVIPVLTRRHVPRQVVIVSFGLCYLLSYGGLILWPAEAYLLWAILLGIGAGTFPLALTMVALRARTHPGVTALSAFTQGSGYMLATIGPLAFGLLGDLTGGWLVPLLMMTASAGALVAFGLAAARPRYLEDHLPDAGQPDAP